MKVYHLDCGPMRPLGTLPINNTGGFFRRGRGVLHCLLIDTGADLILVDTGWGLADYENPTPTVRFFRALLGDPLDIECAAIRQVARLGYDPADVNHIVMTHMHLDHPGGLRDFPRAKVHIYAEEYAAIMNPRGFVERGAYIQDHWSHGPDWVVHELAGDAWFGYACTPWLPIDSVEIRMIPFPGHSRGHCAVAVKIGERWLVNAGDTYGYHGLVDVDRPHSPPFAWMIWPLIMLVPILRPLLLYAPEVRRLLQAHGDVIEMFCSHDPYEFDRYQGS